MALSDTLNLLGTFDLNPPSSISSVNTFTEVSGVCLPDSYIQFILHADGGEGFVGSNYIVLWSIQELYEINKRYEVNRNAPGLLLFGSDGGGEAFAFDLRSTPYSVVSVPFIVMETEAALSMGSSFEIFIEKMYES